MPEDDRFPSPRYGPAERRMAEGLVAAERRAFEARDTVDCDCKEGMFQKVSRRGLLAGGAALGGGLLASGATRAEAPPGAVEYPVQPDPTKEQGRLILDDGGYGSRSQFENEVRWRYPTASLDFELVNDATRFRIWHRHAVGIAFRAASWGDSDDRPRGSHVDTAWHGRSADALYDGRPETATVG